MRRVDALVIDYPETFRCIGETDIYKTYEMPKSSVTDNGRETGSDALIHEKHKIYFESRL